MAIQYKNTGKVTYSILEEYYLDDGLRTGRERANVASDPDFVPPVTDLTLCAVTTTGPPVEQTVYLHIGTGVTVRDLFIELRTVVVFGGGALLPSPLVMEIPLNWRVNEFGDILANFESIIIDIGASKGQTTKGTARGFIQCVLKTSLGQDVTYNGKIYHVIYVYNPGINSCIV